ncbi:peptide chain release factor N(5)-glutamine methyltransferase [Candidatus Marinimicrobia bacterium PRS2]|nr:peptide chain release factor N(5)-glutamine methyltransferase [Candidatus Marinimicrobia bacterium PRS2]
MTTTTKLWRIIDLINWGADHFTTKGMDNARREMEWFLCDILKCERIDLYVRFEEVMDEGELEIFRTMVKRRIAGEPFQHIIGKAPFYGRDFTVNQKVLIPRPETEILIERMKTNGNVNSLLDIGTGTGCIAITTGLENWVENIFATDISQSALEIATENMRLHNLENIQFARHDFLSQNFKTKFDVVVSNPPYIAVNEMNSLQAEVRDYDPPSALTDNGDGLSFYRRFAEQFENLLTSDGYLLLEFGGNAQKGAVESIFQNVGLNTEFFKDLQNDWRVIEVRR